MLLLLAVGAAVFVTRDDGDSPFRTVEAGGDAPFGGIVAVGDVLLGSQGKAFRPSGVVRSRDGGRQWAEVRLPDTPQGPESYAVAQADDAVVIAAVMPPGPPTALGFPPRQDVYLWASADGERWNGPHLVEDVAGLSFLSAHSVGDGIAIAVSAGDRLVVYTSRDAGRSWHPSAVAGLALGQGEVGDLQQLWQSEDGAFRGRVSFFGTSNPAHESRQALVSTTDQGASWKQDELCGDTRTGRCNHTFRAGRLLARGLETSLDSGAHWVRAALDGSFEKAIEFTSVAEVGTGGWLGAIRGFSGGGGGPLAWIVRSPDGVHWKPLLGAGLDGCPTMPADTDVPSNVATEPVRVGRRWLVSFSCPTKPVRWYAADEDAQAFRVLEELGRSEWATQPLHLGDTVLAPVWKGTRLARLLVFPA